MCRSQNFLKIKLHKLSKQYFQEYPKPNGKRAKGFVCQYLIYFGYMYSKWASVGQIAERKSQTLKQRKCHLLQNEQIKNSMQQKTNR